MWIKNGSVVLVDYGGNCLDLQINARVPCHKLVGETTYTLGLPPTPS